ncbi:MAG: [FeFe] hydrogenase H-cluster maturation GTPase HydF [Lachnospiraceae bacterium]|nr:[FeFe] hydrogenase H-cluster maturation GTPase HydF [Lachnospiraceae bacterium]
MTEGVSLNQTPSANRTHIVFMGKMNSGKSALINALANQEISIVSDIQGTTTDPVKKPMEIHGIGPCVLIDTAGFDDSGELGKRRVEVTKKAALQADIAVILLSGTDMEEEKKWYKYFDNMNTPVITVISKSDEISNVEDILELVQKEFNTKPVLTSAAKRSGIDELKERLVEAVHISKEQRFITGNLVSEEDLVLLVMPQDIQAPEGRLILPQVQTIRELLDKKCLVMSVTTDKLEAALKSMTKHPKLIITDSQVYKKVFEMKPQESLLTSFSTLFAAYKGDIHYYVESGNVLSRLTEDSKVLIAECCTHAPLDEDIGREKIPKLLRKRVGEGLRVDIVSGTDFPENLKEYDVIIQCGACMFNRKYVMSRIENARSQGVPMTNYGVAIAWINGILDKITLPEQE